MRVYLEQKNSYVNAKASTGKDLLEQLGFCSEDVILTCNGKIILPEAKLKESDDVRVLSVISGG